MHWILAITMAGSSTATVMKTFSTETECRKAQEEFFSRPHGKIGYSGGCFREDSKALKILKD
ncbi:hypothetical protein PSE10C_53960 [Pseudomonas amygdali pv. eriobotryae]|nr:hypothetical protein [Pseudomonas amygdali]KWS79350.1 hypothetical protein AL052_26570 [Pseudomonas amygdali pv. eriobotryae]RMO64319.1 hypothetical protein ALQ39_03806 [Pseudomonas amygdali pv. eriobotryae]GFZ58668.1 hypothetical protein PSE10A_11790 [Pseudomonas amygdali pv. eriobotryae]GFZ74654.1 hypothetical protein PSE10C_53960 [Pseudomonas amygdali pv. eriobotryae]